MGMGSIGLRLGLTSAGAVGVSISYDPEAQTLCVQGTFSISYDAEEQTLCVR